MNGVRSISMRKGYCSLPLPRLCCLRRLLGRRMVIIDPGGDEDWVDIPVSP